MQPLAHIRKLERKLGVGAYGVVYLGFDELHGGFVAVKEIPYDGDDGGISGERAANQILQEVRVMQRFGQNANLVGYYGARRCDIGIQLVMEYMGGGSVERLLKLHGRLPEPVVRRYTRDILRGLRGLHEDMKVCHRDVKPGNVLLTPEGRCKLTDFGVSKMLVTAVPKANQQRGQSPTHHFADKDAAEGSETDGVELVEDPFMQTMVGTPWYMAPEVISGGAAGDGDDDGDDAHGGDAPGSGYYNPLRGIAYRGEEGHGIGDASAVHLSQYERNMRAHGYTTSADVWSVGVTVFEMISGQRPFGAGLSNPTAVLFRILNSATQPPTLPDEVRHAVSHELRNFLDQCFVYDKALRPSASELLAHPWLASVVAEEPIPDGSRTGTSRPSSAHPPSSGSHTSAGAATRGLQSPPFLRMAHSPVWDAAELPPVVPSAGGPHRTTRRRSSSSISGDLSITTSSSRPDGAKAGGVAPPPPRLHSPGPFNASGCSSRGTPSPTAQPPGPAEKRTKCRPEAPHRLKKVPASSTTPSSPPGKRFSLPPELPALPANGSKRTSRAGSPQGQQQQQQQQRSPPPSSSSVAGNTGAAAPDARRQRPSVGEGFFSSDGHYVDLITHEPSPRR